MLTLYLASGTLLLKDWEGGTPQCKWLDTGTQQSLFEASDYVRRVQPMGATGRISGFDRLATRLDYTSRNQAVDEPLAKTDYGKALRHAAFGAVDAGSVTYNYRWQTTVPSRVINAVAGKNSHANHKHGTLNVFLI